MSQTERRDRSEFTIRRMGAPSWLILYVLRKDEAIPGIEIIRRVEVLLHRVDSPHKRLDPSTLHYALRRMEDDGLVRLEGEREVEVPGPRGTTQRQPRSVYIITDLGQQILE